MPYWAVIRAIPNHDRLAAECVCQAGFETFTPKLRTRLVSRWRTVPHFPGYLFVRVVDRSRILERTIGVLSVVKFGAAPARCPDEEIAKLIARADPDGIVRLSARRCSRLHAFSRLAPRWRSPTARSAASAGSIKECRP